MPFVALDIIAKTLREGGFKAFLVYGPKRIGKSVYAMKLLHQYYHYIEGYESDEAWEIVLDSLCFLPQHAFTFLDIEKKLWIWDDAGAWLSTYRWFDPEYQKLIVDFLDYWDTVGTDSAIIIFTTPTKMKLPPRIREDPSLIEVKIVRQGWVERCKKIWKLAIARLYVKEEVVGQNRVITRLIGSDKYMVKLPDWVWNKYYPIRKQYAKILKSKLIKTAEDVLSKMGINFNDEFTRTAWRPKSARKWIEDEIAIKEELLGE